MKGKTSKRTVLAAALAVAGIGIITPTFADVGSGTIVTNEVDGVKWRIKVVNMLKHIASIGGGDSTGNGTATGLDYAEKGALVDESVWTSSAALTVPSSVEIEGNAYTISYIGADAFNGLANFSGTVAIPSSVIQISGRAFAGCGLTGISFPDGCKVKNIGRNAFNGCSNMEIADPDFTSVETMGVSAFNGCAKVSGALSLGAPSLGYGSSTASGVFQGTAITSATATGTLTHLFPFFYGCSSLACAWFKGEGTIATPNQFKNCTALKAVLLGPDTIGGGDLTAGKMLDGVAGCKVFAPANGHWTGLSVGGSDNEIVWYGDGQDLDLDIDETAKTLTATPKTEAAFTNVLAVASVFKEHFGLDTHIALTNCLTMTSTITEAMLQAVTLDVPPWYVTFKVNNQTQLDNVLAAVSADIPIIIDITDAGKNQFSVPEGRKVAILADSGWAFGRKVGGLVIVFK